ncbi:C2H2 type zinc-finger-domain-containing protein [Mycena floridula]|nr:C2H2 type zinc-finger-domain-containing protein [Mycena floridula]
MNSSDQQPLFTCISCSIAFLSAEEQRGHYRSDHHRYNMKRRVAGLTPVSAIVFNQKVIERKTETAVMASPKDSTCTVCGKIYATENAYRSHLNSKRHKDNELKAAASPSVIQPVPTTVPSAPIEETVIEVLPAVPETTLASLVVDADASDDEIEQTIDEKIAAARSRLSSSTCLFCPQESPDLDENLTHMSSAHSFFIPDAEYLVDLIGLITYLGEKIAVGNACLYCSSKGKEFRSLEAVRKHMLDKSHCKIAYDAEVDRLEISDFYDFSSSYPDPPKKKPKKEKKVPEEGEEWEDAEDVDDEEVDEIVEESDSGDGSSDSDDDSLEEEGTRIGHRSMRRYYAQSFPGAPRGNKPEDPNSGAALVRRLLLDKNSALVPRRGGFGAFGAGTEVVKARNRGEAREAGRHTREFRDQKRREDFKTKVGFIHNSQKHFRDPLLQLPNLIISPVHSILQASDESIPTNQQLQLADALIWAFTACFWGTAWRKGTRKKGSRSCGKVRNGMVMEQKVLALVFAQWNIRK